MSITTLPFDIGPDTSRKTFVDSKYVEYKASTVSVEETLDSHGNEITRLKTKIDDTPDIYSYRGNDLPTLPTTIQNGYYISLYGGSNYDNQTLSLPDIGVEAGSIFSITNESFSASVRAGSSNIDGATAINIPAQNIAFLIRTDTNWTVAFSGFIPSSLTTLISDIKGKLPTGGFTIQEIEAALKDKLHTFREIQNEFSDQLHTHNELVSEGFAVAYGEYDFVADLDSTIPTFLTFGKLEFKDTTSVKSPLNDSYIIFRVPRYMGLIMYSVTIDGAEKAISKSEFEKDGETWILCKVIYLIPADSTIEIGLNFHTSFPGSSSDVPSSSIYTEDEIDETWELGSGTDGHLINKKVDGSIDDVVNHVVRNNFSGNDFTIDEFGGITLSAINPNLALDTLREAKETAGDTIYDGVLRGSIESAAAISIIIPFNNLPSGAIPRCVGAFKKLSGGGVDAVAQLDQVFENNELLVTFGESAETIVLYEVWI